MRLDLEKLAEDQPSEDPITPEIVPTEHLTTLANRILDDHQLTERAEFDDTVSRILTVDDCVLTATVDKDGSTLFAFERPLSVATPDSDSGLRTIVWRNDAPHIYVAYRLQKSGELSGPLDDEKSINEAAQELLLSFPPTESRHTRRIGSYISRVVKKRT